jgi:hypothetical protein
MQRAVARVRAAWLVAALVVVSMATTTLAMRHTSATFDEITPVAVGAYGWHTGDWTRMTRYPPVMQYLYGLPAYLSRPAYPETFEGEQYTYARQLLWRMGNDGEALLFRARLVAVLIVGALIVLTYTFTRSYFGTPSGLLAAGLVAFLPDVMAHGGIAYNDLPLAAAFLAGLWAVDRAIRQPSIIRGVVAGLLVSLAIGIKHSALALGPIALVLLVMEALGREDLRRWLPRMAGALGIGLLAGYVLQVLLYDGDLSLFYLLEGTIALKSHVSFGHGVPDPRGIHAAEATWLFYPRLLLLKTPIAFQLLLALGLAGGVMALVTKARGWSLLSAPARAPLIGLLVFGALLMRAKLVIGFRYALPALVLLAILAAAGAMMLWHRRRELRVAIVALAVWAAASTLSFYPYFIAYSSEYPPGRDRAYEQLFDSSIDWGQGLVALREFMREEGADVVYLGYFGSALPEGYGIKYVPLPSYFPLPPQPPPPQAPKFAVVSATLLRGMYLMNDAYQDPRENQQPYRVLGHTMFVYRVGE